MRIMRITVQQMQNIIELTKEDWKITLTDMRGYQVIKLDVHKIVMASRETLLLYTEDSTEQFTFTHDNSYVEAELNTFKLHDPNYTRALTFENFIPYKRELLTLFKLVGQEDISLVIENSHVSKKNMKQKLAVLLETQYTDIVAIENPLYPYEERKRIFNKK